MTTIARIVTGVTVATALCVPAAAQKVTYDYHRGQDFSQFQTYTIKEAPPVDEAASATTAYDSPIVRQNTNAAIASQLEGRGLTRDDAHPDVIVTARRSFVKNQILYGSSGWGGYGWGYSGYYGAPWSYGYGPAYTVEEIIGTLTIDVTNAQTGELVWRGLGERDMHPTSKPQKRLERVNREVTKIFKNYPATTVATSGRGAPKPTGR